MEFPPEVMEMLASAEEDIRNCQDLIDATRRLNPTNQQTQLDMDWMQRELDVKKKRVREAKEMISVLSM